MQIMELAYFRRESDISSPLGTSTWVITLLFFFFFCSWTHVCVIFLVAFPSDSEDGSKIQREMGKDVIECPMNQKCGKQNVLSYMEGYI